MANEKRLIDANDALERLKKAEKEMKAVTLMGCKAVPMDGVIDFVASRPTVDAVEVVHGIWLVDDYDCGEPGCYSAYIEVHCSKCGYELGAESGQYGWSYGDPFPLNYCPNCGAKMDGDGNG